MAVVTVTLLVSAAQSLLPGGALRKTASLIGGLILTLTMLSPLVKVDLSTLDLHYADYEAEIAERQAELENQNQDSLAAIIAQETEAYISDKAKEMGRSCTAQVTTKTREDGVPYPYSAVLSGERSDALEELIAQDLGIPKERQSWHETD